MLKEEEERRAEIEDDEMLFTYSRDDAYSQVKKHGGRARKIGRPRKNRPVVALPSSSSSSDSDSSSSSDESSSDEEPPSKVPKHVIANSKSNPVGRPPKSSPTGVTVKAVMKKPVSKPDSQVTNHVVVAKKAGSVPVKSPRGRGRPPKVPAVVAATHAATPKATTTKYVFVNHASSVAGGVNRPIQVAVPHVAMSPSVSLQRPVFTATAVVRPAFAVARPAFAVARPAMRIVAPRLRMTAAQPVSSVSGWPRIVASSVVQSPRQILTSVGTPRQLVTTVGTPPRQVVAGAHGTTPPCQVALVVQPWSNPNLVIRTRRASGQLGAKNVIHVRQRQALPTKVNVVSQFATAGTRTVLLSVPSGGMAPVRLVSSTAGPTQNRVLGPNLVYRHVPNNTVPILEKMALQLRQGDAVGSPGGARVLQAAPVAFNLFSRISAAAAQQQQVFIRPQLIAVPATQPVAHADTNGTLAKDPT